MDARFNRRNLTERVVLIASHRDNITVLNRDGVDVIRDYAELPQALFYIDPPYYQKGALLYFNSFNHAKHQELADLLNALPTVRWLLSYDASDEIRVMYESHGREIEVFSLRYSVHQNTRSGSELMIFSDSVDIKLTS